MVRCYFLLFFACLALVGSNVIKTDVSSSDGVRFATVKFQGYVGLPSDRGFMDILGFVSEIMGVYDSITQPSNADLAAQIRDGFQRVESQLAGIQQTLNDIINIIEDQAIRTQYASAERVITESLRCYNAYLNMTTQEGLDYWRGEFLRIGGALRESVSFLLDGMLGRNIFAGDLLMSVVNTEGCRAGRVKSRIDTFMGLINSGIWVHAAYVNVYPLSEETNAPFRSLVESSYTEIVARVEGQIVVCENEDTVPDQMTKLMNDYSGQNTEQFIDTLFNYLADRYDTKYWFVFVYDPLSGFNNHCVSGYFHSVFRQGNKNAVATSFPAGREYRFDEAQWNFLNNFACDNYNNAEQAWTDITNAVLDCGAGAVRRYSGLWGTNHDTIDLSWRNCRDLTTIAVPGNWIEFKHQIPVKMNQS